MARTLNKVMLIGNVGRDPELKHTPSGIPVTSFNLATTDHWKDRSGAIQEQTDWHSIVAWRGLAEVCTKQVKKGSRIFVEGKLQSRKFEDKNGVKKTIVEILVDNLVLLDAKRKDAEDRLDLDQILESDFSLADLSDDDFISMMDAENETQE